MAAFLTRQIGIWKDTAPGQQFWYQSLSELLAATAQAHLDTIVPNGTGFVGPRHQLEANIHTVIQSRLSNVFYSSPPLENKEGCAIARFDSANKLFQARNFCDFLAPKQCRPKLVGGTLQQDPIHVIGELKAKDFRHASLQDVRECDQALYFTEPLLYGGAWVAVWLIARCNQCTWAHTELKLFFASHEAALFWLQIHRDAGLGGLNPHISDPIPGPLKDYSLF